MRLPLQHIAAQHKLAWLLVLGAVLRLMLAQTGFGVDEIYAVATSREFHLSGYDHPPMAWWLSSAMQQLFHSTSPWLIRLPFVLLSTLATWQMFRLTRLLFGDAAGFYAALAFTCAPVLGMTSGSWVLPDGPLLLALLSGAVVLARLCCEAKPKGHLWLWAGFWGGVALLSKYHGVFFFSGALLCVLSSKRQWHWLRSPWPYLGVMVGMLVFSPVVIWNVQHDFASFAFQSGRAGESHFYPLKPLQMLLGQALFLTPWIWLGLVVAAREAVAGGVAEGKRWLLLCLGVPPIALFTLLAAGASSAMFYHWAMPGYLFLFPLLGDWLARKAQARPRLVQGWSVASAGITATLVLGVVGLWYAPASVQALGIPRDPLAAMRPLDAMVPYLNRHAAQTGEDVIVAPTKWYSAGQFDVALAGKRPVTCFCQDARGYGVLAPLSTMVGRNFLIPVPLKHASRLEPLLAASFCHLTRLDDLVIPQGGTTTEPFAMFFGEELSAHFIVP